MTRSRFLVLMPHRPPGRYIWDYLPDVDDDVQLVHFDERELALRQGMLGQWKALRAFARRGLAQARPDQVLITVGAAAGVAVEQARRRAGAGNLSHVVLECIIYPKGGPAGWLKRRVFARYLRGAAAVVCGATSEAEEYVIGYGLARERIHVATLFAAEDVFAMTVGEVQPGSVFSGGNGQRDYGLLVEVMRGLDGQATIVTGQRDARGLSLPGHVSSPGTMPRERFLEQMAAAEVVALPLRPHRVSAGQMVLLQAMALGKPLVVSDSPAVQDYVKHEQTALVVPAGSPQALAAAITRLRQDEALRQRLGAAARREAEARFRGVHYAKQVRAILERVEHADTT